jgi:hypothetical protein
MNTCEGNCFDHNVSGEAHTGLVVRFTRDSETSRLRGAQITELVQTEVAKRCSIKTTVKAFCDLDVSSPPHAEREEMDTSVAIWHGLS